MPIAANFLRHTLKWNLSGGEKAACTVHWKPTAGTAVLDSGVTDAFTTLATSFWENIQGRYAVETKFVGSSLAIISPTGAVLDTASLATAESAGTVFVSALPSEVAVCCTMLTSVGSRQGRGRIYMPNPHRDLCVNGGLLLAAAQTSYATAVAGYCSPLTVGGNTYSSCVYSKTGTNLHLIQNVRVGNVFDSQRRRRDRLAEVTVTEAVS